MATVTTVPEILEIDVYQGTTLSIPFQVRSSASGPVVDITGYDIRAQVRRSRLAPEIVATFASFITNGPQGLFSLVLTADETAAIPCGEKPSQSASKYVWDLEIESPSGVVTQLRQGPVRVHAQVTR